MILDTCQGKLVIFGFSRGLGQAFTSEWRTRFPDQELVLVGRKQPEKIPNSIFVQCDLSVPQEVDKCVENLLELNISRSIYFAGGGPYGLFHEKKWHSHLWGLHTTFISQAQWIYSVLRKNLGKNIQHIAVGSAIAESQADPMSASYCAAKHALKGMIITLNVELKNESLVDLRLFSPGYLDTAMVPQGSAPRREGFVLDLDLAAHVLVDWMLDPRGNKHYIWDPNRS